MQAAATAVRFLFLVLFITGLLGCEQSTDESTPPAAGPVPVTVVTLKAQEITLKRELAGRTSAYLISEIRPQVSGIIEAQLFEEGSFVEAGQPLYQLDDALYEANLSSANASLAQAKANLGNARTTANRLAKLVETNAVSQQEYDEAQANLRAAEAAVEVSEAAVQRASIELAYAQIKSPISGRVGVSNVTQGALVTANQPDALTTVRTLDPIYVDLTMSASELLELRQEAAQGDISRSAELPVTIHLDNGIEYPHQGKLSFADLTVNPGTGSFLLRIVVPNPDLLLMPGMYVRATVSLAERHNAVLAPQKGITRNPQGTATALVVNENNAVEQREVRASRTIGDQWLVEAGLQPGDRVIVEGLQKVQPGVEVEPTEAATAPLASGNETQPPATGAPAQ